MCTQVETSLSVLRQRDLWALSHSISLRFTPEMMPRSDRLKEEEVVGGSPPGPASFSSEGLKEQSAACTFTCA